MAQDRISFKQAAHILKDFDLMPPTGKPSLLDFFNEHFTSAGYKQVVVFTYYISEILLIGQVNQDHVLTCFSHLKLNLPSNVKELIKSASKPLQRRLFAVTKQDWHKTIKYGAQFNS